ncbi:MULTISPECIES: hypothetical protein [Pseudomonas]|uniref:CHAT domain-containing protein n=1 Tax=Pseudomonas brassicacearum (strain NFM421) TaxID=994484 RepID=F2K735_PSEBN|nr:MULTISPECIES: hypothetical protein [Pseudomonas]AEA72112.1 Hypothetical protein PSEBR_m1739 [Pseudomonas brassicacearum subsp. brassicacearum NFM421]PJH90907.1 hypothetical protein CVG87_02560 [Pseudomonas sp. WCS365]ROM76507.1 hypothetical protein BK655_22490 [Pseudomonas brassicacearum]UII15188.1 hypothetical protein LRP86_02078 [Pseudomonas brassicacearum]
MATVPDVFIIETLAPDDEGNGRFEGSVISSVLRLHEKKPIYRYVRTRDQFVETVTEFGKSGYRYLHISAHGNKHGLFTTNQDEISYTDLAKILAPHLKKRRLFLSACSMVHEKFLSALFSTTKCISIVGPRKTIYFSDAAVTWPAIYHLMFSENTERMTRALLKEQLAHVCALFKIDLAYYSKSKNKKRGYTHNLLPD